jgi:hypothetical protein
VKVGEGFTPNSAEMLSAANVQGNLALFMSPLQDRLEPGLEAMGLGKHDTQSLFVAIDLVLVLVFDGKSVITGSDHLEHNRSR